MNNLKRVYTDINLEGGTTATISVDDVTVIEDYSSGSILFMTGGHVLVSTQKREELKRILQAAQ